MCVCMYVRFFFREFMFIFINKILINFCGFFILFFLFTHSYVLLFASLLLPLLFHTLFVTRAYIVQNIPDSVTLSIWHISGLIKILKCCHSYNIFITLSGDMFFLVFFYVFFLSFFSFW